MSVSQFRVSIATSAIHSECINKEIGKRTNLWVPESVRSPLTEGRFLSCLPSSSRIQNAASTSDELQNKYQKCTLKIEESNDVLPKAKGLLRQGQRRHFAECVRHAANEQLIMKSTADKLEDGGLPRRSHFVHGTHD
ncbi:hypothetical protein WR25_04605 [Diploscapter pachys]|uniref:Uncharacterized protein n=1 Tax=Diploscapter pachys TaxID=2018661 RepID=A0A2A2LL13_9BILA|nr:hypothetical protein WR25_04605 [Diploscapter pachys]